jgi:aryl-alcohol dehydrogenase-like predicted oxidoreductase
VKEQLEAQQQITEATNPEQLKQNLAQSDLRMAQAESLNDIDIPKEIKKEL